MKDYRSINRRNFLRGASLTAAGMATVGLPGFSNAASVKPENASVARAAFNVMDDVLRYRKIDAYGNAYARNPALAKSQIEYADKFGIEKLFIAVPVAIKMGRTPDEFREYNDQVLKAMKQYPGRLIGQLTIHPAFPKESLEEIKRCTDQGMVGMKLYNQLKINDPLYFPVIEQFIDYKMIIHVHGESQLGVGGYRMKYDVKNTPTISVPEDFVEVARRFPEAMFQYAHIGGGSDWEYACKSFRNQPNIYVDTGGSNNEEGMIDFAVKTLGEDRVFFGCDSSYIQGVGKVLSSALTRGQKKKVFFENYNNVLKKSGRSLT